MRTRTLFALLLLAALPGCTVILGRTDPWPDGALRTWTFVDQAHIPPFSCRRIVWGERSLDLCQRWR